MTSSPSRFARAACLVALAMIGGCSHPTGRAALQHPTRVNCLVLSVGGPAGVAHLGAIEALRAAHVPIGCVVGSSMGAVVGSLYAVDPQGDTTARFEHFAVAYERTTRAEAESSGGLGMLVGALLGALTGGAGAVLIGAAGGAMVGASGVRPVDHQRFVRVLDSELGHASIEDLSMPFTTMHHQRSDDGASVVPSRTGLLSDAVGASAANPFIFGDLDPRTMRRIDPGFDSLAAIPVRRACEEHPGARLITINVTGEPPLLVAGQTCEVVEVRVTMPIGVDVRAAMMPGPVFRRVVDAGRVATEAALARYAGP